MLFSNIIVKGLGFFYRVVLVRLLGVEGVGLVEMVAPIFSFLLVLAGCGLQTSLSQSIASSQGSNSKRYFHTALIILIISSSALTALAYFAAPWLIDTFAPDSRILLCFTTVLPAIIIICTASAFRGLFQGNKQVGTLGMSQNIEQIIRVAAGILLIVHLAEAGIETRVSAASIATVCGELAGFLYLIWVFKSKQHLLFSPQDIKGGFSLRAAKDLFAMGLPLTGSRLANSAIMMLQALLIPLCLKLAGWDIRAATELYGRFSGVAMALLHLPGVFTTALTVSVLPAIAESMTYDISGHRLLGKRVNSSLQAASSFTLIGMILLFLFADPLCTLLFDNPPAAALLQILALGGCFLYLEITLASVLQGLGEVRQLLFNNIISGIVLLLGIVILTPLPALGIKGAAIACNLAWVCGFFLNLLSFYRKGKTSLNWRDIAARPLFAAAIAIVFYYFAQPFFPGVLPGQNITTMLISGIVVAMVYLLALYLCGGLIKFRR